MFGNWTNRDWCWLVSYLIFIIIILISNFYLEWETNLSMVSSATSIALAVIAIFLSLKQDTDNKQASESMRREFNSRLDIILNDKNSTFEDVADNVEKSVNTGTNQEKEIYTYEDLVAHGEKIKIETINSFKNLYADKIAEDEIRKALIKYPNSSINKIKEELNYRGFDVTTEDIKNFIASHVKSLE